MPPLAYLVLGLGLLALAFLHVRRTRRRARRAALMREPLPAEWLAILRTNIRLYRRLPEELKTRLHAQVRIFLAEKSFEACGALEEVTDEMRVTIAGQACLLLLNGRNGSFADLRSILLYPDDFRPERRSRWGPEDEGDFPVPIKDDEPLLGESWNTGSVLLSWSSVRAGARGECDGINVVLHEFAHQLDHGNGDIDGAPALADGAGYARWARVMEEAYARLGKRSRRGQHTVMDPYGATDPGEFFAVATEAFFESPLDLRREDAALYGELRAFYGLDPAEWDSRNGLP